MTLDESYVTFAIRGAKLVCPDPEWNWWADDWLSGKDRSWEAAEAAQGALMAAASAAARAANAAAWVTTWSAAAARTARQAAGAAGAAWAAASTHAAVDDILRIARETLPVPSVEKWKKLGLTPQLPSDGYLLWKHVNSRSEGNMDFPYRVGIQFCNAGMACAGPLGALRDWESNDTDPHLIAIDSQVVLDYEAEKGVYMCVVGTPISFYRARIVDGELERELLEGVDAFELIERR